MLGELRKSTRNRQPLEVAHFINCEAFASIVSAFLPHLSPTPAADKRDSVTLALARFFL